MLIRTFINTLLEDPEYENIQDNTLETLNILPSVTESKVQLQLGFSLSSAANQNMPTQTITPPFCACFMIENDKKLIWNKHLREYNDNQSNSIIALSKEILKSEYLEPLNYSYYKENLKLLEHLDYYSLLELMVDKALIEKRSLSKDEKKNLLDIVYFFNGVPEQLINYYNTEGKFLADWLRNNCF
jgi:hypothetical protein